MADFRRASVASLKWFPQSRTTVPVTPIRVQTPPGKCVISLLPGRYSVELTLSGHPAHPAFVRFLEEVERHALQHARQHARHPSARWFSCTDADSLVPTIRLSAFDDTRFYDRDGSPHACPTDFEACACLLELTGAWTTETAWGLRWKVLEIKRASPISVACLFLPDPPDGGFDASHDHEGDVVRAPGSPRGGQLAKQVETAVTQREPGHLGEAGDQEH